MSKIIKPKFAYDHYKKNTTKYDLVLKNKASLDLIQKQKENNILYDNDAFWSKKNSKILVT